MKIDLEILVMLTDHETATRAATMQKLLNASRSAERAVYDVDATGVERELERIAEMLPQRRVKRA